MNVMDMRVVVTVVSFVAFIGIVIWAYSGRQKARFDEAAALPFADDDMQQRTIDYGVDTQNGNTKGAGVGSLSAQEKTHG